MHIEIDKLYFNGDRVGIDFEYDEDFRNEVANVCGSNYLSKKQLQVYIVEVLQGIISEKHIKELKQFLD